MGLALTTPPALEPVPLAEAKTFLRASDDDALIAGLITAARITLERLTGLALISQVWTYSTDITDPAQIVKLPVAPVLAITTVTLDDVSVVVKADLATRPVRLRPAGDRWVKTALLRCIFTAGYGADSTSVPEPLRRAILMLVAQWYDSREAGNFAIPKGFMDLIAPWMARRIT